MPHVLPAVLIAAVAAFPVQADDWGQVATISSTLGVNANRLCVGEGLRSDIGCPSYAPYVSATSGYLGIATTNPNANIDVNGTISATHLRLSGNLYVSGTQTFDGVTFANGGVSASGIISATSFSGDGSQLTGLASGDRITSGTTNVIAAQDRSVTISTAGTQRVIFGENGNVGIGTTAPGSVLTISSSAAIPFAIQSSGGQLAAFTRFSDTNNALYISAKNAIQSSGNQLTFGNDAGTSALYFRTGGSDRILVNSNGVGIGTATPQATLQVSGSFVVSSTQTNLSPSLYINSAGNVGVGTSGPTKLFHLMTASSGAPGTATIDGMRIEGAGPTGIDITTGDANSGRINFGSPSNSRNAAIWSAYNSGTQILTFRIANNERARLTAGGMGVATTDPSATLHIAGSALTTSWTYINANVAVRVTPTTPLEVSGTVSATNFIGTFSGDGTGLTGITAASSDRITSGTTNVVANNTSGYVSFTSAGTTTGYYSPGGIFAAVGISTSSNQASFTTIYASGNVGIGTNSTTGKLSILANGNATGQVFGISSSSGIQRVLIQDNGSTVINGSTAGVSSAVPVGMLTVTGKNTTESQLVLRSVGGNITTNHIIGGVDFASNDISSDSFAVAAVRAYANGNHVPNSFPAYLSFSTMATNALIERMRIDEFGNIGIGTTSPAKTLDVSGTAQIISRTLVGGTGTPSATLQVSGSLLLAGNDNIPCTASVLGLVRRNPTTGRLQACR